MKVTVLGKQLIDFANKETGEVISGVKVFFGAPDDGVEGLVCDKQWFDAKHRLYRTAKALNVGQEYDFTYENRPGKKYSTLADIEPVKSA